MKPVVELATLLFTGVKRNTTLATLQDLVDDVAAETTQLGVLDAFIKNLQAQIAAVPGLTPVQQAQIDGIFAGMEANKAAIAAAMAPVVVTPPPPVV